MEASHEETSKGESRLGAEGTRGTVRSAGFHEEGSGLARYSSITRAMNGPTPAICKATASYNGTNLLLMLWESETFGEDTATWLTPRMTFL